MSLSDAWEREAGDWIRWARTPGHDAYWRFHRDQFLELLPPPGRLTVDVGCGEGRLPRDLARRGHRVIGVDVSATLIDAARKADAAGDYRCASAAALPLDDGCCDLAVAFMSLQDVDDLGASVSEIARILVPGGVLAMAIVHPINSAGEFADESAASPFMIRGAYLAEAPYSEVEARDGLTMRFHSCHRPLEAYSRALEAAALPIEAIREHPVPAAVAKSPGWQRWQRLPLFLHLRARKTPAA